MQETWVRSLGQEDPLEGGMAAHSSILDWKILWPEEPVRWQSRGSRRVGHDWATNTSTSKEAVWTSSPDLYITHYTCTSNPAPQIHQLLPMAIWGGAHITNKERKKFQAGSVHESPQHVGTSWTWKAATLQSPSGGALERWWWQKICPIGGTLRCAPGHLSCV